MYESINSMKKVEEGRAPVLLPLAQEPRCAHRTWWAHSALPRGALKGGRGVNKFKNGTGKSVEDQSIRGGQNTLGCMQLSEVFVSGNIQPNGGGCFPYRVGQWRKSFQCPPLVKLHLFIPHQGQFNFRNWSTWVEPLPSLKPHFLGFYASVDWIPSCHHSSTAMSGRLIRCKHNCDNPEL